MTISPFAYIERLPEETLLQLADSSHCLTQIAAWICLEELRSRDLSDLEHPDFCKDFVLFVREHLDLEQGVFCDFLIDTLVEAKRDDLLELIIPTHYPQSYPGIMNYLRDSIDKVKEYKKSPDQFLSQYLDLFAAIKKNSAFRYSQDGENRIYSAKTMYRLEFSGNTETFVIEAERDYFLEKQIAMIWEEKDA